jgi:hypothetical protein
MKIVFVLPSAGGGGGAHSIVQEAVGLNRLGLDVSIATPRDLASKFRVKYPELAARGVANPVYSSADNLKQVLEGRDLAIATTALSVRTVIESHALIEKGRRPKLGYYVQDYEPLFYPPGSANWMEAKGSFGLMRDGLLFAKTDWLCSIVEANHNVGVRRVQASIDHDVYYPVHQSGSGPLRITAMVRPQTQRRAPKRTIRSLERLASNFGEQVELSYFGCEADDLERINVRHSPALVSLGVLSRAQVAATLRHSDMFLDLSDFQAFGRTGLEAMACGCVPILPVFGGTDEYAEHGLNSYLVDTRSDEQIFSAAAEFIQGRVGLRTEMRKHAIRTALRYSVGRAAYSEYELFREYLQDRVPAAA